MYYVYVLQSEIDNKLYIGYTKDLKLRIEQHERGYVESTLNRRPLKIIYYEPVFLGMMRPKGRSTSKNTMDVCF